MPETPDKTLEMLERHHRDGARFAAMMKEGFERRYDVAFWAEWEHWMGPVLPERPVIIDLGAGPGMLVQALGRRYPGARVTGVEVAPYMLEAAVELPEGCALVAEDLHDPHLPLAAGSVDAAHAAVVFHEMNQPVRALQEVARVLRPGGRFYITDWVRAPLPVYVAAQTEEARVFDATTPVAELDDLFVHFMEHNRYSAEDLVWLLERTGFNVLATEVTREGRYARLVAERRG